MTVLTKHLLMKLKGAGSSGYIAKPSEVFILNRLIRQGVVRRSPEVQDRAEGYSARFRYHAIERGNE
jgi:hypothetical protein